ncbi:hypothetical protein FVEN_g2246 [Fusarium venenatum]|uniref:Uncharacterized protein n=1 Tax=Fusarium venenatum TaxID=56646 RepID=A0A2L2SPX0_9HYPO|nr:uncharacterized protein FVRRES_12675 [Fusarium venenatum]KAG8360043.1 hypothetical protein FVEN_g2246 [Fusarium venenatum]CEI39984.1 unnamed protein product [Fusarium venenatum]
MYRKYSSSPPSSFAHLALSPPETFPIPKFASTFRSSYKQDSPDTSVSGLTENNNCSVSPIPLSNFFSRQLLFSALELGDYNLQQPRSICSSDDLGDTQLKRCFEILHACHMASDEDVTFVETRLTMEEFLKAVFKDWSANDEEEMTKPKMDFARGYLKVGYICSQPSDHRTFSACTESSNCETPVFGIATYKTQPAQLSISFTTEEPFPRPKEPLQGLFCPIQRHDVRHKNGNDWVVELRDNMKSICEKRVARYNKRLAVWHARVLIREWAKGSICMGRDVEVLSFVLKEAVDANFAMMGQL